MPGPWLAATDHLLHPLFVVIDQLHNGIIGDYVACLGVSEVGAGSDVASIKTRARRDGGDYVIDGGKMWTTNGTQADWMCLLANTGDGPVHRNKTLICLPMKTKGVTVARSLVGDYVTSLDMAGCSLTLLRADDELLRLWDAPVETSALRWGR